MLRHVEVRARDGVVDALLAAPDGSERLPGVLQLTDGLGLRPEHAELSGALQSAATRC